MDEDKRADYKYELIITHKRYKQETCPVT